MTKKESIIILFSITLCWSSAYIFIKDIPADFSIYSYLTLTSGVAGLILLFLLRRRLKEIDRLTFIRGLVLAVLIMGNMIFEKFGLDHLPASAVSTIASMNIVIVPLILIFMKQFPSRNQAAGIVIILAGILISNHIALTGNDTGDLKGTVFVLLSCIMMSLYTVLAADYTKKSNPLILTMLQMCLTALFGLILWLITDPASVTSIDWSGEVISYIFIIAFFSKCYAYLMLMLAEKYADALSVTIVASMDPVVTLMMAVLIPDILGSTEVFSVRSLLGAVIIAIGAIVAGTTFLGRKKTAAENSVEGSTVNSVEGSMENSVEGSTVNSVKDGTENREITMPEEAVQEDHLLSGNLPSPAKTFFSVAVLFAVLGITINVMEFAGGYSKARPENALPAVAGLLFGPIGAAACSIGNLLGDFTHLKAYGLSSILGLAANFLAAFIPFKIWFAVSGREVKMHTWKNILLFLWAVFAGNMFCSCLLGYGLEMMYGNWQVSLIRNSFINNFGFSVCIGLPSVIVLTSDDVGWNAWKQRFLGEKNTFGIGGMRKILHKQKTPGRGGRSLVPLWSLCVVYTILVGAVFAAGAAGVRMQHNVPLKLLSAAAVLYTIGVCLMPEKGTDG